MPRSNRKNKKGRRYGHRHRLTKAGGKSLQNNKQQPVLSNDVVESTVRRSVLFGNEDIVSLILGYVDLDTLDTCALVSKTFAYVRNDATRFDQTRTGTIFFRDTVQHVSLQTWQRWNQEIFIGNRTRLVAKLTTLELDLPMGDFPALEHVRQLVLRRDPLPIYPTKAKRPTNLRMCRYFHAIARNLNAISIRSSTAFHDVDLIERFSAFHVVDLIELGPPAFLSPSPFIMQPDYHILLADHTTEDFFTIRRKARAAGLKELYVNEIIFHFRKSGPPLAAYCKEGWLPSSQDRRSIFYSSHLYSMGVDVDLDLDYFLLQEYPNLERVDLRHTCYWYSPRRRCCLIPQQALIKFVRHMPSLRWFRSHLTVENIAMLQVERPEVHFVAI